MPETKFTAIRNLPSPTGKDFVPEGPAEIEALAKALDEENAGDVDFLQAGVVKSSDWSFVATMENGAACALASTGTTGGIAWLSNATIGLVRSSTPAATLKALVPPSKPSAGKYMSVGFQLAPGVWGGAATVSLVSGVEKATQAEAEAAPAGEVAGRLRIRDVVILNTAGVYSVVHQTDRRSWATGGETASESAAEGKLGSEAVSTGKLKALAVTATKIAAGAIETAKLAAGAVTGEKIAKNTITGDKLAVNEELYNRAQSIAEGAEQEPSATRASFVIVEIEGEPGKGEFGCRIEITASNTSEIGELVHRGTEESVGTVSFVCPAGAKWHWKTDIAGKPPSKVNSFTILL